MSFFRKHIVDILCLIYVTIVFLAIDGFYAKERFLGIGVNVQGAMSIGEYIRQFAFVLEYILAIFSIFITTKINKKISLPFVFILWLLIIIDLSFHLIQNRAATLTDIGMLNDAIGNTTDAVKEYMSSILKSIVLVSLIFIPVVYKIFKNKKNSHFLFWLTPVVLLVSMYAFIFVLRGEPALLGFPKGYSFGFGVATQKLNSFIDSSNEHNSLGVKKMNIKPFKKIIVIIDESVEYNEFKNTQTESPVNIIDYGQAFSGANCSASSNFIIRRAGWKREDSLSESVPIKNIDSFFSLAKKANYQTVFLDNQRFTLDPGVKNYIDKKETSEVDQLILAEGENDVRDMASLNEIERLLKTPEIFIFVNKIGAHFPYESTIPVSERSTDKTVNYRKSLKHNTHDFLKKLSEIIDQDTIVFYTSDHGQDVTGRTSHCNTGDETKAIEYTVPFQVMTKNTQVFDKFLAEKQNYANKLTHLEFSESVRNAMGYEIDGIDSIYKEAKHLDVPFCGLYGVPKPTFGVSPRCKLFR